MDRFDMAIQLESISVESMPEQSKPEPLNTLLRSQVERARALQQKRQSSTNGRCAVTLLESKLNAQDEAIQLLQQVGRRFSWSMRSWHRALRVARTIADLDDSEAVELSHVSEAVELRRALDLPS